MSLVPLVEFDPFGKMLKATDRESKDARARLGAFCTHQEQQDLAWYQPDLAGFRDHLLAEGKSRATISAYLSTIRGIYKVILIDNAVRDAIFAMTPRDAPPERRIALVNEMLTRIQNAIHPTAAPIKQTVVQDVADSAHLRMTDYQAEQLLSAPDISTLPGLRDAAVIAMLLCTGVRADELTGIFVDDLRQSLGRELALRVRHGKGDKQRLVPYGDLDWCLTITSTWLNNAGVDEGPVFRGFYKGAKTIRKNPLTTVAVENILAAYPIIVNGDITTVKPHDCRRTYARLLYDSGMDLVAIKQNLGHSDIKTTLGYIGELDAEKRRARSIMRYYKLNELIR